MPKLQWRTKIVREVLKLDPQSLCKQFIFCCNRFVFQRSTSSVSITQFKANLNNEWTNKTNNQEIKNKVVHPKSNAEDVNLISASKTTPRNNYYQCGSKPYSEINSNALWFFNELQRNNKRNVYLQNVATFKTYSFHNIKAKKSKDRPKSREANNSLFEKLRKIYRETIKIKTRPSIMKKKRACHLEGEEKEAIIEALIEEKWNAAKAPLNIEATLSKHIIKQAERKESVKPDVALNCSYFPYIPCPLQQPEDNNNYISKANKSCNYYKHTSLAPLFTVDPIIINKKHDNNSNQQNDVKCIGIDFWSQFENKHFKRNLEETLTEDNIENKIEKSKKFKKNNSLSEIRKKEDQSKSMLQSIIKEEFKPTKLAEKTINKVDEIHTAEKKSLQPVIKTEKISKLLEQKTLEKEKLLQTGKEGIIKEKEIKELKSNICNFKKNLTVKDLKEKNKRNLNLNLPFQMTSPSQNRHKIRTKSEFNSMIKSSEKLNNEKFKIHTNENKFSKQLNKPLENGKVDKPNYSHFRKIIANLSQTKLNSTNRATKFTQPRSTSPNNNSFAKNKS